LLAFPLPPGTSDPQVRVRVAGGIAVIVAFGMIRLYVIPFLNFRH
jgi:hypothetical protein